MADHRLHRRAALPPSLQGSISGSDSLYPCDLIESLLESMTIVRIAMERQRRHRPVLMCRGGNPHLAPELISLVYLALADTFHIWFMNRVQLVLVVLALRKQPIGEIQKLSKLRINDSRFALDVPGNPAKIRLQDPCLSPGTLELLGMRIAALLPKGILARAGVRLP